MFKDDKMMVVLTGIVLAIFAGTMVRYGDRIVDLFTGSTEMVEQVRDDAFTIRAGTTQVLDILANDSVRGTIAVLATPDCGRLTIRQGQGVDFAADASCQGEQVFTYCVQTETGCLEATVRVAVVAVGETPAPQGTPQENGQQVATAQGQPAHDQSAAPATTAAQDAGTQETSTQLATGPVVGLSVPPALGAPALIEEMAPTTATAGLRALNTPGQGNGSNGQAMAGAAGTVVQDSIGGAFGLGAGPSVPDSSNVGGLTATLAPAAPNVGQDIPATAAAQIASAMPDTGVEAIGNTGSAPAVQGDLGQGGAITVPDSSGVMLAGSASGAGAAPAETGPAARQSSVLGTDTQAVAEAPPPGLIQETSVFAFVGLTAAEQQHGLSLQARHDGGNSLIDGSIVDQIIARSAPVVTMAQLPSEISSIPGPDVLLAGPRLQDLPLPPVAPLATPGSTRQPGEATVPRALFASTDMVVEQPRFAFATSAGPELRNVTPVLALITDQKPSMPTATAPVPALAADSLRFAGFEGSGADQAPTADGASPQRPLAFDTGEVNSPAQIDTGTAGLAADTDGAQQAAPAHSLALLAAPADPAAPIDTLIQITPPPPADTLELARLDAGAGLDSVSASDAMREILSSPACAPVLTSETRPGAEIGLRIAAPCHPATLATISHGGLEFSLQTRPDGTASVQIPAMQGDARIALRLGDGIGAETAIQVPEADTMLRVAITWPSDTNLTLNAFEFGARAGEDGHVHPGAARNARLAMLVGGGYMQVLGRAGVPGGQMAAIYTLPQAAVTQRGTVRFEIALSGTEISCGDARVLTAVTSREQRQPLARDIRLTLPECSAQNDTLWLTDVVDELRVFAR